jgi:hypothetical protein
MAGIAIFTTISREFELFASRKVGIVVVPASEQREISFTELKGLLLSRTTSAEVRDLIWRQIAQAAQSQAGEWSTVALGLALPGLSNLAKQFAGDYVETNYEDVCAEVVTAFLEALQVVDTDRPAILTRMYWATYRAVRRSAYAEVFAAKASAAAAGSVRVASEDGHPDLVLAGLVAEGVITDAEAGLISAVRLDRRSLGDVADVLGVSTNAVLLRLRKAEMRVAAYLTGTAAGSRRAFKQGRKSEVAIGPDSFGPAGRTSAVEEPPGILAA